MKNFLRGSVALLPGLLVVALSVQPVLAKSDSEQIGLSVGRLLEEGHYTHHPLNDEISRKLLTGYLEIVDFSHLFFTQKDIDAFTAKYGTTLDDDILLGNLKPSHEIFSVFQEQVSALLEGGVDLLIFETFSDLQEIAEGIRAARELTDLPIIAQMTFTEDVRTPQGHSARQAVEALSRLKVEVI